jgi:beta-galactosidase
VVERAPGDFHWDDYARMLDLAEKNGIRVVLAEMLVDFPEWLIGRHPEARVEMPDGRLRQSEMHISSVNGGHRALCLNHEPVRDAAAIYLRAMAERFRGHPALVGYDIWNECTEYTAERLCFCAACQETFRSWVKARFGQIDAVAERWQRPSLTDFSLIELPRRPVLFADFLDSIRWRNDDAQFWMRWRGEVLKSGDPEALTIAHGNAKTHVDASVCVGDDFRAAENCEIFGYTHYFGNGQPALLSADLIRGAAAGRPVWRAEAVGGPQWLRRKIGEAAPWMDELDHPAAIRLDALITMAGGGSAYLNPRWRPLLAGPLFDAFGWYDNEGGRTAKSEEIRKLAAWAANPAVAPVWKMRAAPGDVAIVLIDEAQDWCYGMYGDTAAYGGCVRGIHRGLAASRLSSDFLKPAGLAGSAATVAYVPFPTAMSAATIDSLVDWAESGGHLVLEACAGYFDEIGKTFPRQPSRRLGNLFGSIVEETRFNLDVLGGAPMTTDHGEIPCGLYRQHFHAGPDDEVLARHEDGSDAILTRRVGTGRITLLGSNPSYAMQKGPGGGQVSFLLALLDSGNKRVAAPGGAIIRRFEGEACLATWILNPGSNGITLSLPMESEPLLLRGEKMSYGVEGRTVELSIPPRDAALLLSSR